MFPKIFSFVLIAMVLVIAPPAFAGKVELTTYYPAPYGEYKDITTHTLKIGNGNTATAKDGVVNFNGLTADPSGGNDGDLYYNAATAGSHKFRYYDNTADNGAGNPLGAWKDFGGGANPRMFTACPSDTSALIILTTAMVDLPGLSITENFPGGNIVVSFSAIYRLRGTQYAVVQLVIDGAVKDVSMVNYEAGGGTMVLSYAGNLSAGNHTIKIQGGGLSGPGVAGSFDAYVQCGSPRLTVVY